MNYKPNQRKRKDDGGRNQKHNVQRVGKGHLIFRIIRTIGVQYAAVISNLNLTGQLRTVRVPVMQQEFARSEPTRIEVGKVSAWRAVLCGIGQLMPDKHMLQVEPHARGYQQAQG